MRLPDPAPISFDRSRSISACARQLRWIHIVSTASLLRIALQTDAAAYEAYEQAIGDPRVGARDGWSAATVRRWRVATIAAALAWGVRPRSGTAGLATIASGAMLQRSVIDAHRPMFSYTNHVLGFLSFAWLGFRGPRSAHAAESLRAMELYVGAIYMQSALAKLLHGGRKWVTNGSTVRVALSELGRDRAVRTLHRAGLERVIASSTVALELSVLPWIGLSTTTGLRRGLAAALSLFHGGLKTTIDISFWHLWVHAVALLAPRPCGCPGGVGR
jgi:hypothetical protein